MERAQETADILMRAARQAGADQVDVIMVSDVSVSIGVAGGALEEAERAESREIGLRVILGARQACVSSSDIRPAALQDMADRAVAMAREAPDDPYCALPDGDLTGGHPAPASLDLVDADPLLTPDQLEALALEAETAALSVQGVSQVEQAHASLGETSVLLCQSNGFTGGYGKTSTGMGVSVIAGSGLGRERDYAGEYRRHRADLPDAGWIGRRAGMRAVERLSPRKPPGGSVPVLYDERVAPSLINHVLGAINGSSIARGSSWLSEAMGTRILPAGIDLIEDPLIVRGMASRPFDAEGMAAAVRPLVRDGVLERWILDWASARKLGLRSTGNARRGTSAPPSPGISNVRLTQGRASRDDLIAAMGTGLVVTSMIGSSISATTGAYSRGASGFWVENGEIAYPVNEITIAGMLPDMMRSIVPANDADPHRGVSVPSLLVEGLTVGA